MLRTYQFHFNQFFAPSFRSLKRLHDKVPNNLAWRMDKILLLNQRIEKILILASDKFPFDCRSAELSHLPFQFCCKINSYNDSTTPQKSDHLHLCFSNTVSKLYITTNVLIFFSTLNEGKSSLIIVFMSLRYSPRGVLFSTSASCRQSILIVPRCLFLLFAFCLISYPLVKIFVPYQVLLTCL